MPEFLNGIGPSSPLQRLSSRRGLVIDWTVTLDTLIINVDFSSGGKAGYAAVGNGANDYWNVYNVNAGWVTNLKYSDTNGSGTAIIVDNFTGDWGFSSNIDPMYNSYLYPAQYYGGSMTITNLPSGTYDFYMYGHGPAQEANTVFVLGPTTNKTATTLDYWESNFWTNGYQYVVFTNISVSTGQTITFNVYPGDSGYTLINGMQVAISQGFTPPPEIAVQPQAATRGTGGAVNFSVKVVGTAPLTYQWLKNGSSIAGATAQTHAIIGLATNDQGMYSVTVTNAGGGVTTLGVLLTVTNGGTWIQAPSGIVGFWPANGTNEDVARHATTSRTADNYATGVVSNGFSMTGPSSGSFCFAAKTPDLNVGIGSGFTVEGWVKRSNDTAAPLFEWASPSGSGLHVWANYEKAGDLYANLITTNGTGHGARAPGVLPSNTFVHVALTYNNASGDMIFYVNGDAVSTNNEGSLGTLKTDLDFYLGYRPSQGQTFNGILDEPSVYNRALGPGELAQIFAAGKNGKRPYDFGIDPSKDLLLIYNANSLDSSNVCNYYRLNRPLVSQANVLPIACTTNSSSFTRQEFTNILVISISNWFAANPTKRPQYVILFQDIPWRINTNFSLTLWPRWYDSYDQNDAAVDSSVQHCLHGAIAGWHPYVTALNMRDPGSREGSPPQTGACTAYINKLKSFGSNSPSVFISASTAGYSNLNYLLDDVRIGYADNMYPITNSLLAAGVAANNILYISGADSNSPPYAPHLTNAVNVAGYMCWGAHSCLGNNYALPGATPFVVTWTGNSGWWIIETIESANGMPFKGDGDYFKWFSASAFGGASYSNAPVGAVTHTDEPYLAYINDAPLYFALWAKGASFSYCAWKSKRTDKFQALGDPFVSR